MIARVGKKNKSGGSSGFKYRARSAEDVKKRADQTGGSFDSPVKGVDMWRPKPGDNLIRILPATWEDFEHYGYDVFMHRFIGSDSSNYLCLNKMKGKPCPACDEAKSAKDGGEEDEAKALAFQKRTWVWMIDRDDKSETPQIWDISWAQDRDIAALSHFKSGKILLIDHPDDGYDINVRRSGQGLKTKYQYVIERDSSPISDDQDKQEEILQFIMDNPIPTVFQFYSPEHIERKLAGTTEDKDKDLDEDEKPRKGKRGKARDDEDDEEEAETPRRRRKPDDDEEEAETPRRKKRPAADDDDDEEEKPKRRKPADDDDDTPKRKRERVEEEDDDEEEAPRKKKKPADDDDDEEEAPRKKKKPPAEDDDDEDEPPRKKRRAAADDDEEEERPARRRA